MKLECCSFVLFLYNIITVFAVHTPHRSANIERRDWHFDNVRQNEAKTTSTKGQKEDVGTGRRLFKRMQKDWHITLGVSSTADEAEVKKAYRKLAMRYHPDKASEELKAAHEEKMKAINSAYLESKEEFIAKGLRAQYNANRPTRRPDPPPRPSAGGGTSDPSSSASSAGSSYRRHASQEPFGNAGPFPGFRPSGSSTPFGGFPPFGSSRPSGGTSNTDSSSGNTRWSSRANDRTSRGDSPPLRPFGPDWDGPSGHSSNTYARDKKPHKDSPYPDQSSGSGPSARNTGPFSGHRGSFPRDKDSKAPGGSSSSSDPSTPSTSSSDESPSRASSSRDRAGASDQPRASSQKYNAGPQHPFRWTSPGRTTYKENSSRSQFRWKSPGGTVHRQSTTATDSFYARQQHADKAWRNAQEAMRGTGAWSSFSSSQDPPRSRRHDSKTGFNTSGDASRPGSSGSHHSFSQQTGPGSSMPGAGAGQPSGSTGTSARHTFTRPGPGSGPKFARTRPTNKFTRTHFMGRPVGVESTASQPGMPPASGSSSAETSGGIPGPPPAGSTAKAEPATRSSRPTSGTVPSTTSTPVRVESVGSTNIKQPSSSSSDPASSGSNKKANVPGASSSGSAGSTTSGTSPLSAFQRTRQAFNNPGGHASAAPSGPASSASYKSANAPTASSSGSTAPPSNSAPSSGTPPLSAFQRARQVFNNPAGTGATASSGPGATPNPAQGTRFTAAQRRTGRADPPRENSGAGPNPIPTRSKGIKDLIGKFESMGKPKG